MQVEAPRARRLVMTVPVTYRTVDEGTWLQGRIVNVSESGVLFAPAAVETGQAIELIFTTSVPIESIGPGKLICAAKVVRTEAAGVAAACFNEVRFLLEP